MKMIPSRGPNGALTTHRSRGHETRVRESPGLHGIWVASAYREQIGALSTYRISTRKASLLSTVPAMSPQKVSSIGRRGVLSGLGGGAALAMATAASAAAATPTAVAAPSAMVAATTTDPVVH